MSELDCVLKLELKILEEKKRQMQLNRESDAQVKMIDEIAQLREENGILKQTQNSDTTKRYEDMIKMKDSIILDLGKEVLKLRNQMNDLESRNKQLEAQLYLTANTIGDS